MKGPGWIARPGCTVALICLVAGLAFLVTGSAEGGFVVLIAEGAFWAFTQFFKDRRHRHQ
jgi:hypothetical protein